METLAARMRTAALRWSGQPVSLRRIAALHGRSAHGALLVLLAVPCLLPLPGAGTVLSFGIAAFALMMWRGRARLVLPWRVGRWRLPPEPARRTLNALAWLYARAGRVSRARMSALAAPRQHGRMAPWVALMALLIFLPIPFGNVLPALALTLLGVGLMFRDGMAVLAALGVAVLALTAMVLLAVAAAGIGASLIGSWPFG